LAESKFTAVFCGWEGYRLGTVGHPRDPAGAEDRSVVWVELLPDPDRVLVCSGCGGVADGVHDTTGRWVRDLPMFDAQTHLLVHRCRVRCPRCGPKLEALAWLSPHARVTDRLAESVARMCKVLPVKHVAGHFGLGWDAVKAIDRAYLDRTLGEVDLDGLEQIAMDEVAIRKGHTYATVVVEPRSRRVLWVGHGRGREDVGKFYDLLGPGRCAKLKAIAMDMNPGYVEEAKARCPGAERVFDLFHVVAKYGHEVVDRVRVDAANAVRHDKPARKLIKGSRWLLLKNAENIGKEEDRVKLSELLKANRPLMKAYVLKDDLKRLWDYRHVGYATRAWRSWFGRAVASGVEPIKRFARKLKEHLPGILSHCRYPLNTSVLEGINNKIKVIKRMAYGFRDDDYFFLKIRSAFPGKAG
jgi:transposase